MNPYKIRRGFTLIELIIAMALVSLVIGIASSMMVFSIKSQEIVAQEFQIQSEMRIASEIVNQQVRYASAVFLLNQKQFSGSSDLKNGWSYFALSTDKKQILHYKWNEVSGAHDSIQLSASSSDVFYGMTFGNVTNDARMVHFKLEGHRESTGDVKVSISSELNALNSVVVDDSGTSIAPSVTLAYRSDDVPDPEKIKVAVTLVLDKSGSMGYPMGGSNSNIRMTIMKSKASDLIDTFAAMDNVYVSLIPFSTNANNPGAFLLAKDNKVALKATINGLNANGGTNAGDGLRRSYYQHVSFNSTQVDKVLNYTILLMDGNPTYYPSTDGSTYFYLTGNISDSGSVMGGNGSSTTSDTMGYIQGFSNNYIKNITQTQTVFMKTFVIGFTAIVAEVARAKDIANYHTLDSDDRIKGLYFEATSSEELANVFNSIADVILQETWHIYGPTQ